MKKTIAILLLMATMLSAFSIVAFAGDDNATGGDGNTHPAAEGFGWYNSYQYLYKVTLFVGKTDTANKQSSLTNDFYRIGTVIVKKSGWSVSSKVVFGNATKIDYYGGIQMTRLQNPYIISDANCPKIPICCGGDIDLVKQYFGSTGTMNTLLNAIASKQGCEAYDLLKTKTFTINGVKKSGWESSSLLPNGTSNKVPWVIVYEPMILMHLKDKVNMVAFTATEYAIAQQNGWYDWRYSKGEGQNVAILPERHLPSSIQLEESWFGYPVYPVHDDSYKWAYADIVKGGGWGMRWLGAAVNNGIDLSVEFMEYDPAPIIETSVNHKIKWRNNKNFEQTVLCEIYSGDYLVTSYTLTIPGNSYIIKNTRLIYHATRTHKMIAKINYANRYSETNPNNNTATVTVIPKSSDTPAIDYGCYFGGVEPPEPDSYGQVEVTWKNYKRDFGTVLCELYRDDKLVWSGYKSFEGYESITDTYSVYYPGTVERTLTAKINYAHKDEETDPNDNMRQRKVQPVAPIDGTYDFSVSDIEVVPDAVYQGQSVKITFRSDNWNKDIAYQGIPVELLIGGEIVKTELVDFTPYGSNYHSYTVQIEDVGTKTVAARINWDNRYDEDNSTNNYTDTTVTGKKYYEFSVNNLVVTPVETEKNGTVSVSFKTDNWDEFNSYENIPVQIVYNGKVVYTSYENYEEYGFKLHNITLNVGDSVGSNELYVRINWQDHLNEANTENNETESVVITVKETADLWLEAIEPNSEYRAGTQVVTSYIMHNDNSSDVIPSDNNTVTFEAYYYDGKTKVSITKLNWENAVIPAGNENLVYFKWTVPDGIVGKKVYAEATVNAGKTVPEISFDNNGGLVVQTVAAKPYSATPDTRYERERPSGFKEPTVPGTQSAVLKWSLWKYENGSFVKHTYGYQFSDVTPTITPDQNSPSAGQANGKWTMKSGYGFSLSYAPSLNAVDGCDLPPANSFTSIQSGYATFPEFRYLIAADKYRTLTKTGTVFQFEENPNAENNGRIHFTPLWYPDGDYCISVIVYDFWTPAGMATVRATSNKITISGSAYDDWFLGR